MGAVMEQSKPVAPPARARLPLIAAAIVFGLLVSCAAAEVLLRMTGRQPWQTLHARTNEPTMHEPDAQLGWRPIPGRHVIEPYKAGGPTIAMTLLADGTRVTAPEPAQGERAGREKIAFIGGSTTQGWAIDDDETFAWRLQQRFPTFDLLNYGVTAYGTYQSLLVMERLLAGPDPPRKVFYGFDEEHEPRNVADLKWLLPLALLAKGGIISTPYVTLDTQGQMVRHQPETYPHWPLREHSALVTFLQERYADLVGGYRTAQAREVTGRLMLEMQRLAEQHGSQFTVVLFHMSPATKQHYVDFLTQHHVDFLDCAFPITGDVRVRGDHHPNGAMNAQYADCIAPRIETDK